VVIDGVRFLGSILWTDFGLFGEAEKFFAMQQARQRMTDFSIIQNHGRCFTPADAIRLHSASRDWLAVPFNGKTGRPPRALIPVDASPLCQQPPDPGHRQQFGESQHSVTRPERCAGAKWAIFDMKSDYIVVLDNNK
jgi:hypothetical protein